MGNYVFDTKTLIEIVTPRDDTYTDSAAHVIPALTKAGVAHVYDFSTNVVPGQDERERGYWRDVGTIDAYYDANMDLIAPYPVFNLYNDRWPVFTYRGAEPPAKVSRGPGGEPSYVDGSLLCEGSIVSGAHVERSIVAPGVYVDHDAHVTDSILFQGVQGRPRRPAAPLHRRQERRHPGVVPRRPRRRSGRRRRLHGQRQRHHRDREGPQAHPLSGRSGERRALARRRGRDVDDSR